MGDIAVKLDDTSLREAFEKSDDDNQARAWIYTHAVQHPVTVCIDVGSDGKPKERLDAFLSRNIAVLSRSALARIIKAECVTLNGKPPKPASKLKAGDQIVCVLAIWFGCESADCARFGAELGCAAPRSSSTSLLLRATMSCLRKSLSRFCTK
eukprot:48567-Rhodomonas_salina.6